MKVVVVGAGIVGHAVAYELASRGAEVRVVDPRGSGQGATRASAGVLAPYIEGHAAALLRLGLCSLDHYDSFVARVSRDAQSAIEYRRSGTLQIARNDLSPGGRTRPRTLAAGRTRTGSSPDTVRL